MAWIREERYKVQAAGGTGYQKLVADIGVPARVVECQIRHSAGELMTLRNTDDNTQIITIPVNSTYIFGRINLGDSYGAHDLQYKEVAVPAGTGNIEIMYVEV